MAILDSQKCLDWLKCNQTMDNYSNSFAEDQSVPNAVEDVHSFSISSFVLAKENFVMFLSISFPLSNHQN